MDPSIMDFSTAAMRSVTKRDFGSPTRKQVLASRKRREVHMLRNAAKGVAGNTSNPVKLPSSAAGAAALRPGSSSTTSSMTSSRQASARRPGGIGNAKKLSNAGMSFLCNSNPRPHFYPRNAIVRREFFSAGSSTTLSEDGKVAADLFYSRARPWAGMPVVVHTTRINRFGTTFSK